MSETIADINAWLRRPIEGENAYLTLWRNEIADRIEAAEKREREAGAEAAQICGEIGEMVGREEAKNKSVTDCNRLDNEAKMREALENIAEYAKAAECHTEDAHLLGYLNQIAMWAEDALSAPPRNCDVGTPDDQHNRFMRFCDSKSMGYCWGRGCRKCMAQWGQIPYEGENKEIKK